MCIPFSLARLTMFKRKLFLAPIRFFYKKTLIKNKTDSDEMSVDCNSSLAVFHRFRSVR